MFGQIHPKACTVLSLYTIKTCLGSRSQRELLWSRNNLEQFQHKDTMYKWIIQGSQCSQELDGGRQVTASNQRRIPQNHKRLDTLWPTRKHNWFEQFTFCPHTVRCLTRVHCIGWHCKLKQFSTGDSPHIQLVEIIQTWRHWVVHCIDEVL